MPTRSVVEVESSAVMESVNPATLDPEAEPREIDQSGKDNADDIESMHQQQNEAFESKLRGRCSSELGDPHEEEEREGTSVLLSHGNSEHLVT